MRILVLLTFVFIVGCSNSLDDLNEFIEQQKKLRVKPIDPLPQLKPHEVFEYNASAMRDPFSNDLESVDEEAESQLAVAEGGEGPDLSRRKEFLESYPLDSLLMVGTYQQDEDYWALVVDPEGTIHRVSEGHYLGHNHGKVVSIFENEIQLQEWINDGLGAWRERSAAMALREE